MLIGSSVSVLRNDRDLSSIIPQILLRKESVIMQRCEINIKKYPPLKTKRNESLR